MGERSCFDPARVMGTCVELGRRQKPGAMGIGSRRDSFLSPIDPVDRVRCPVFPWIVDAAGRAEPSRPGLPARMAWHPFILRLWHRVQTWSGMLL